MLRVTFGDEPFDYELLCPICGFNYNHVAEPAIQPGNDDYSLKWGGRGGLVSIPFWCENGHNYLLCFGFHKGVITTFWKRLPDRPSPAGDSRDAERKVG